MATGSTRERVRAAFLSACAWDVAARKPGNVSQASAGHRMQAQMFLDSAAASVDALTAPGAGVGARVEAAVAATWARVGCNTNLGILLLCAPIALAAEHLAGEGATASTARWAGALAGVMHRLDADDAAAVFRAIARARPGGLGRAPEQDVHAPPSLGLREAMGLAAGRDRIALQYRDAGVELFSVGLAALAGLPGHVGQALRQPPQQAADAAADAAAEAAAEAAVQALYLAWLASAPDSHIVRKHGLALAQTVMQQARPWRERVATGLLPSQQPEWTAWDDRLKAQAINPGTSADLTVASLMLAALQA
jgi:triphosphoribosyl-dephospho-CoA synthase